MKIIVNDKVMNCADAIDLAFIPTLLQCNPDNIAMALNQTVIHKQAWSTTQLKEQDRIDVFQVVAGG
ncbi:sulfur carrier protein ThiS [Alteromonas sp. ASW11-130]|uniref:sulfur carrier protein ThiS n=1 Tax=Alteromonas sp. ASW11-130 TaxID=3015775 RepID=UPI0022423CA4|nr:sulfur carrier protein ThiS [Alteromonas sp. ASW11-130]